MLDISSLHPLVAKTYRELKFRKGGDLNWIRSGAPEHMCVAVTAGSLDRAVQFLDVLVWKLESLGHPITFKQYWFDQKWRTVAMVHGQEVSLRLWEEKSATGKGRPPAVSVLRLYIAAEDYLPETIFRRRWSEGKRGSLEDHLPAMLETIAKIGAALKAKADESERREKARIEGEKVRAAAEADKKRLHDELEVLLSQVRRWKSAREIREYADAVKDMVMKRDGEICSKAEAWLKWARSHADRIDPLVSAEGA